MRPECLFVSYAGADEPFAKLLGKHLAPLTSAGELEVVVPDERSRAQNAGKISEAIARSSIVVLVMSADYVSSDSIRERDLRSIRDRFNSGLCAVIPVLARPVAAGSIPWLNRFQRFPRGDRSLADGSDAQMENDMVELVHEIQRLLSSGAISAQWDPITLSEDEPVARRPPHPYPLLGPYQNPRAFRGRGRSLRDALDCLRGPGFLLCIHAPSGAGKSSFLQACLAPTLRRTTHPVSLVRYPDEPDVARKLLENLAWRGKRATARPDLAGLERDPRSFAAMIQKLAATEAPPVFILDQMENVLRSREARGAIGPLLSATALVPGSGTDELVCRWVFAYRQEYHGEILGWLEDILKDSDPGQTSGLAGLPRAFDRPGIYADLPLPPFGSVPPRSSEARAEAAATRVFAAAILAPLAREGPSGARYPFEFDRGEACKLAAAFARARVQQPWAPLVPELQVVLADLLAHGETTDDGRRIVRVGDDPGARIRDALRNHLHDRLEAAFPCGVAAPSRKVKALVALRDIARAKIGDGSFVLADDFERDMDEDGLLAELEREDVRLVLREPDRHGGERLSLSHDVMVVVVVEMFDQPEQRERYGLDAKLFQDHRTVSALMDESDPSGEPPEIDEHLYAALTRARAQIPWGAGRREWWERIERSRTRRAKQRARRAWVRAAIFVGALVAVVVSIVAAYVLVPEALHRREIAGAGSYTEATKAYAAWMAYPGHERAANEALSRWFISWSVKRLLDGDAEEALLWRLRALELHEDGRNRREISELVSALPPSAGLLVHEGEPKGGVLSRDGRAAITWTAAGAHLWDISGDESKARPLAHEGVAEAAFDGKTRFVVTRGAGGLKLWRVPGGEKIFEDPDGYGAIAFDPEGEVLVAWSSEKLRFWSTRTGHPHREEVSARPGSRLNVDVAERVAVTSNFAFGGLTIYQYTARKSRDRWVRVKGLRATALSADGAFAALVTGEDVRVIDTRSGAEIAKIDSRDARGALVGPGARVLVVQTFSGATAWDLRSREKTHEVQGAVRMEPVGPFAWICAAECEAVSLADGAPLEPRVASSEAREVGELAMAMDPREPARALARAAALVKDLDIVRSGMRTQPNAALDLARHGGEVILLRADAAEHRLRLERRPLAKEPAESRPYRSCPEYPTPDGTQLVRVVEDDTGFAASLWSVDGSVQMGPEIQIPAALDAGSQSGVGVASGGPFTVLAAHGWRATVQRSSGEVVCERMDPAFRRGVDAVAISLDGRIAVSRSVDHVELWDPATCGVIDGGQIPVAATHVALSPDGDRVLLADPAEYSLWDTRAGARRLAREPVLVDDLFGMRDVAFSASGEVAVVGAHRPIVVRARTGEVVCDGDRIPAGADSEPSPDGAWLVQRRDFEFQLHSVSLGCAPVGDSVKIAGAEWFDFTPDGKLLAVFAQGWVHLLDVSALGLQMVASRHVRHRPRGFLPGGRVSPSSYELLTACFQRTEPVTSIDIEPTAHPMRGDAIHELSVWRRRLGLDFAKFGIVKRGVALTLSVEAEQGLPRGAPR